MFPTPMEGLECPHRPSSLEALPTEPDLVKALGPPTSLLPLSSPGSILDPSPLVLAEPGPLPPQVWGFLPSQLSLLLICGSGCPLFAQSPTLCLCLFTLSLSLSFSLWLRPAFLF